MSEKKTSLRIESQLPDFIKDYYTNESGENLFVLFVKAYYEWAEQTGQTEFMIRNAKEFFDVDTVFFSTHFEQFKDYFFRQFLPGIPKNVMVDKRLLIKHGKEFYLNKGNENSFRFLFKILYNDDISIFIPSTKVLTFSDPNRGIISGDCKIHDSYFWQQFSYQLASETTIQEYRDIVLKLLHPAGLRLFGKFLTEIEVAMTVSGLVEMIIYFQIYASGIYRSAEVNLTLQFEYSDFLGPKYSSLFNIFDNEPVAAPLIYAYPSTTYAASNTTTIVYCKALGLDYIDGSFVGQKFTITAGTGATQTRTITAWDNQDNAVKVTVSPALSATPDTTSEFIIFRDTPERLGAVTSAAAGNIGLSADELAADDYYNNRYVATILYGPGVGERKLITDYNGTTKVATIDGTWTVTPTTSSIYIIEKNGGIDTTYFTVNSSYPVTQYNEYDVGELEDTPTLKSNITEIEMFISTASLPQEPN